MTRWSVPEEDEEAEARLAAELRSSRLLARLLRNRGVCDREAAERFLEPKLSHLHDPLLLPEMSRAVERIALAIERREKVAIFGDYDVDGISSTCLLLQFFRFIEFPVQWRLPNRLVDGYGLKTDAVRELASGGVQLIITVDNGSCAFEEVSLATELGVDVVITDHHQPSAAPPRSIALVNPWTPGSRYPFQGLAGVGVAFKLLWALCQRLSKATKLSGRFRDFLLESLALVSLGTIADVVPLLDENRALAKFGLRALQRSTRPGLRSLVALALEGGRGAPLDAEHVGFRIGPCLNAAGRLGRVESAMRLVLSEDEAEAGQLARLLSSENQRRKAIEREMVHGARQLVEEGVDLGRDRAIVLGSEGWHSGVLGIVAARIAEAYHRPTLLLTVEGERARGSARSVPGVHICEALAACSELLIGYGGHEMAAGVEMRAERLGELRAALNAAIPATPEQMLPRVKADAVVALEELTPQALGELRRLEPHGHGNPRPLLIARGLHWVGEPRRMGATGEHVAFHVRQRVGRGLSLRAVAFRMGERVAQLRGECDDFALLFEPQLSRWQGALTVELHVRGVEPERESLLAPCSCSAQPLTS